MNVRRQVTGLLLMCLVACRHVDATTAPTAIPSKPTQVPQPTATSTQVLRWTPSFGHENPDFQVEFS